MLDDHIELPQYRWTEAETLTRRLQREFLTIAEFGLMSTMSHDTGGSEVRCIATPALALKQSTAGRTATR